MRIHIGVPGGLGVDHSHRASGATVQAARLVDPDLAGATQPRRLDLRLAAVEPLLRAMVGAAFFSGLALVEAEKNVPLVIDRKSVV